MELFFSQQYEFCCGLFKEIAPPKISDGYIIPF